jgi:alkanesulfonate monooxygenase SsuD/methylene tetrahydromethanopterin reductase-like flavin-dependent oxidoreductase (luciferase family)
MTPVHIGLAVAPTWLRGDSWRRADSRVEDMFTLDFSVRVAAAAERGRIDFLFAPDFVRLNTQALSSSPGLSSVDSLVLMSALVAATEDIGLVPTVHTSFTAPYVAARQLMSLQHLSNGRIGWSAVTGVSGHPNVAATTPLEQRYDGAHEFVAVVRELWDAYPADALTLDRTSGHFADADRVVPIDHTGEYFTVAGPLTLPAHPSGPPAMFQAGDSDQGRDFAARYADVVFAATPRQQQAQELRADLARRELAYGRPPGSVNVLAGLNLVLAESRTQAGQIADDIDRQQSIRNAGHWTVIGTPADAVEAVTQWVEAEAIDGFIVLPQGWWGSIDLFVDAVVPALVDRGLFSPGEKGVGLRARLRPAAQHAGR